MNKWAELNDFSMFEGNIPCIRCKADSSKTLLGDHWKCSVCAHVFNQDGSDIKVQCYCEACLKKLEKNKEPMIDIAAALKQLKELEKKQKPKKSKKKKK
jgi:hypothetical protein